MYMPKPKIKMQKANLTDLIDRCRYDRKEIAKALGLKSIRPIIRWEKGEALPDCVTAIKLAVILKTHPEHLYPDFRNKMIQEMDEIEKSRTAITAPSAKK